MQLLWQGIAGYVLPRQIDLMFGCASLPGTDPEALAVPLSYLYHNHLAPEAIRPRALPERYTEMDILPPEAINMPPRAGRTAAAGQGLPSSRRLRRRRRGDRPSVQHHRCLRDRQDRPGHRQILSATTTARQCASSRAARCATSMIPSPPPCGWSPPCSGPWRWPRPSRLFLALGAVSLARRNGRLYWRGVAFILGLRVIVRGTLSARRPDSTSPIMSPISTSSRSARCSMRPSSPKPRSRAGRASAWSRSSAAPSSSTGSASRAAAARRHARPPDARRASR